jgi:hypothetical protein
MIRAKELFEYEDPTKLDFCLWAWLMSEIYKTKVDTPGALLTPILDAASHIKECKHQLRRTKRDFRHYFISF